jgi:hypothetical protein
MAYTTESFTIDGVNYKDIQCYGKNNPSINGCASMIRQWIKQKYPKYSGSDGVSVTNSKFAGGFSISVNFNRIPEEDFEKINSELQAFFEAEGSSSGYHTTYSSRLHTATNGDVYKIYIKYLHIKNTPKYGSTAYNNPAPNWSSMSTPKTSATKGGFKKFPTRKEFGDLIRQCAGWDIYQKDGTTYLKKQKDTEPNKDKWNEILGTLNTQEGFFWRRTLQAFERNVILTEAQLDSVCNLLSKYYTSKSEPTSQAEPTPPTTQPTSTFPPKYFVVEADKSDDFVEFANWGKANNYDFNIDKNDIINRQYYWKYYGFDGQDYRMDMTNYRPSGKKLEVFTAKEFMDKLKSSGNYNPNKTTTSDKELFENQINKLKKLALISSKEDAQLFNNQIEKLNKLLKLLN